MIYLGALSASLTSSCTLCAPCMLLFFTFLLRMLHPSPPEMPETPLLARFVSNLQLRKNIFVQVNFAPRSGRQNLPIFKPTINCFMSSSCMPLHSLLDCPFARQSHPKKPPISVPSICNAHLSDLHSLLNFGRCNV